MKFNETTGEKVITGGIDLWLRNNTPATRTAIVAVTENELGKVTLSLLKAGFTKILVEKPGGATYKEIYEVAKETKKRKARVFVAYNRRFNASTEKTKEIIKKDGKVLSFNFEFTEWSHVIGDLKKAPGVKENWFLHNSSHVIDLAFFLGGVPKKITSYCAGGLSWHPSASIFAGAGVAENGALFSYQANWQAPGRWGVEVLTPKHRLILRPLEHLCVQEIGSVAINNMEIDNTLDTQFKPGLYNQVEAFLYNKKANLCPIEEQSHNLSFYKKIQNRPTA